MNLGELWRRVTSGIMGEPKAVHHDRELKRSIDQAMIHFKSMYGPRAPWRYINITLTHRGVASVCVIVDEVEGTPEPTTVN